MNRIEANASASYIPLIVQRRASLIGASGQDGFQRASQGPGMLTSKSSREKTRDGRGTPAKRSAVITYSASGAEGDTR